MLRLKQGATDRRLVKKNRVFAAINLDDGSTLQVHLFAEQQSRLTDVLNDDRTFLPVQTSDGKYLAIAKSTIRQVVLDEFDEPEHGSSDPYRILRLERGVSLEEVKRAYYELLRMHHPDRIRGLGLGAEYQRLSTRSTVRINQAYTQLLKSFEPNGDAGEVEVQKQIEAGLVEAEIETAKPNVPKEPADQVTAVLAHGNNQSFELNGARAEVEIHKQTEAGLVEAEIETAKPNVPKEPADQVTAVLAHGNNQSFELNGARAEVEIHKQTEAELVEAEIETAKPNVPKEPADQVAAVLAHGNNQSFELNGARAEVEIHKQTEAELVEAEIKTAKPNVPKEPADQVRAILAQGDNRSFELNGDGAEVEVQKQIEAELVEAEIETAKPNVPNEPADQVTAVLAQGNNRSFELSGARAEVEIHKQIEAELVEAETETAEPNVPKEPADQVTAILAQDDNRSFELSGDVEVQKQTEAKLVGAEVETAKPNVPKEPADQVTAFRAQGDNRSFELIGHGAQVEIYKYIEAALVEAEIETAKPSVPKEPADQVTAVPAHGDDRSSERGGGGAEVEIHAQIEAEQVEAEIETAKPNFPKEPADQVTAVPAQGDDRSFELSGDGAEVKVQTQIKADLVEAEIETAKPNFPKEPADQVTAVPAQGDDRSGAEITWPKRARALKQARSRGPALPQDWISFVNRWAKAQAHIHRVYVFGSRSRGVHRADSDLDLAVMLSGDDGDEKLNCAIDCQRRWKAELQQFLPVQVDLEVDPQPSSVVGRAVQRQGRLIFSREMSGTSEHAA